MTEATVSLVEGMQFVVETGSGHSFIIDSAADVGGRDSGPRPFVLLVAAAAGRAALAGADVPPERVAHAIGLSQAKCCAAVASLRPGADITSSFRIREASEETMAK